MAGRLVRSAGWSFVVLLLLALAVIAYVGVEGRPPHGRPQYVAMGSSFAAGPAITEAAADSPWFCARSRDNYAHQLARLRGLDLVDVSCGGATTHHILDGGQLLQPPQIAAVAEQTELVTVTIGGNDIGYLANLVAMGCDESTPWYLRAIGACRTRSLADTERALRELETRLGAIVAEVHRRAPAAKVVLVTYPAILPESGTCARLGLGESQAQQMRTVADRLAEVTRSAAESGGALLLDARRSSRGHDVCAPDPWMNGMHPEGGLPAAPLHPTLAGMTAIAAGLDALLGAPR